MLDLSLKTPLILQGLAAEVDKAPNFEEFRRDFLFQIKHGLYYHVTSNPNFNIDPLKGPRDASSLSMGRHDAGKLMITSHLECWVEEFSDTRDYVALIDMTDVPRKAYWQVNRGFGNEFYVDDPSKARVVWVKSISEALEFDEKQHNYLPGSEEALYNFYLKVRGLPPNEE